jgi:hypothetical protein
MVRVPLIPKAILRTKEVEAVAESHFRNYPSLNRIGDESDEALKYHLFFSDSEVLQKAGLDYVTEDVAVYNAYYWLLVCAKRRRPKVGSTADYEEHASQILEHAACELDWTIIEEVWRLAGDDVLQ